MEGVNGRGLVELIPSGLIREVGDDNKNIEENRKNRRREM